MGGRVPHPEQGVPPSAARRGVVPRRRRRVVVIAGLTLPRQFLRSERPPRPPPPRERVPSSTATLAIDRPTAGQTVSGNAGRGRDDARRRPIVDSASTTLTPDTGHIHLSLDGTLVSMTYGLVQLVDVSGLSSRRAHDRGGVRRRRSRTVRSARGRADHVHDRRRSVRRVVARACVIAARRSARRSFTLALTGAGGGPCEPRELGPGGERVARPRPRRGHDDVHRAPRPEAVGRPRAGRERHHRRGGSGPGRAGTGRPAPDPVAR